MSSDAQAIIVFVLLLVLLLAAALIPLNLLAKKNSKKRGYRGNADSNISSTMNDINNLNL